MIHRLFVKLKCHYTDFIKFYQEIRKMHFEILFFTMSANMHQVNPWANRNDSTTFSINLS
jgi:hypothetical protein